MGSWKSLSLTASSLLLAVLAVSGHAQNVAPPQNAGQGTKWNVEQLFATSCGWCHQDGGRVQGRGPKLAGTDKSDEVIIRQIKNGKSPGMPAFGKSFSDEQIRAIVVYIRELKDRP